MLMVAKENRDVYVRFGNVQEELEKGLRDEIKIERLGKGNPGNIIKVEETLKLKKHTNIVELEDIMLEFGVGVGVGDHVEEAVRQLVLVLSDKIRGEKVFDYWVKVEFGRDLKNRSTLIIADVVYAVPLEE